MEDHIRSSKRSGSIEFFIVQREPDCVISRMPVAAGMLNPYGIVQAGAMVWLADVTASVLILENQPMEEKGKGFPLAVDLHTSLVGNQREGEIKAEARFVKKGRKVSVIRTRLTGDGDRLLAEITSTHVAAG
ncbi:MAG: PaaI family thioesterase [Thermodesulfobacteriota bacterium]